MYALGYQFVMEGNLEPLALKKAESFSQYVSLYPEYSFVFIGDNGQGDLRCAEMVMQGQEKGDRKVEAVYIHRVQPLHRTFGFDGADACKGDTDRDMP